MLRKENYKDLEKWKKTAAKQRNRYYNKTTNLENNGREWTEEEIRIIMEHAQTDHQISKDINRSVRSIQVKRSRVKAAY